MEENGKTKTKKISLMVYLLALIIMIILLAIIVGMILKDNIQKSNNINNTNDISENTQNIVENNTTNMNGLNMTNRVYAYKLKESEYDSYDPAFDILECTYIKFDENSKFEYFDGYIHTFYGEYSKENSKIVCIISKFDDDSSEEYGKSISGEIKLAMIDENNLKIESFNIMDDLEKSIREGTYEFYDPKEVTKSSNERIGETAYVEIEIPDENASELRQMSPIKITDEATIDELREAFNDCKESNPLLMGSDICPVVTFYLKDNSEIRVSLCTAGKEVIHTYITIFKNDNDFDNYELNTNRDFEKYVIDLYNKYK